jgi:hypothetical protein
MADDLVMTGRARAVKGSLSSTSLTGGNGQKRREMVRKRVHR